MSMPIIQQPENPIDREQSVNDLIESVALIETGLSHIINAEGEKIQKVIKYDEAEDVPIEDILMVNESVSKMLCAVSRLEMMLQCKLELAGEFDTPTPVIEDAYLYAASIDRAVARTTVLPDEQKVLNFTISPGNNAFTAQVAGTYLISYRMSTTTLRTVGVDVVVNGTIIRASEVGPTIDNTNTTSNMYIQDLAVGDVVQLNVGFTAAPPGALEGITIYLSIVKI